MTISSQKEIFFYMKNNQLNLIETILQLEALNLGCSVNDVSHDLSIKLDEMKQSVREAGKNSWKPKIVQNDSLKVKRYKKSNVPLSGNFIIRASEIAIAVATLNASMGRIVAAPTAGSCGILPGMLFAWEEQRKPENSKVEMILEGLIVAACIGQIIAKRATLAGAEGGCQAECGAAMAMGSSAIVWMEKQNADQCFHAASLCLKSIMGLVCDPVAGLVEVPCIKRNGTLVSIGALSADLAMAGVESIIPFDEVVDAMYSVGIALPVNLRETGLGGLATTPSGLSIANQFKQMRNKYK